MNYRDLYEFALKVSEELMLTYELKEMYRDFNKNSRMKKQILPATKNLYNY